MKTLPAQPFATPVRAARHGQVMLDLGSARGLVVATGEAADG